MRTLKILAVVVSAIGLPACSSSGSEGGAATTTSSPAPSTEASSTTSLPAVTSTTSTTIERIDEEKVLAVFEAYMGFEFDERANGYGPSEERIELYTIGALKQRALETLQARKDAGVFLVGPINTLVESVDIEGDSAEVLICFQDSALAYFGDGSVADGTIGGPHLMGLPMQRSGASWVIVEQRAGDAAPCDL